MINIKSWLDSYSISVSEAAKIFGKSEGTIKNWRSSGVPESQQKWVSDRAAEHQARMSKNLPDRITLTIEAFQFDNWNKAALKRGQLMRTWAIQALNDAANEEAEKQAQHKRPGIRIPEAHN